MSVSVGYNALVLSKNRQKRWNEEGAGQKRANQMEQALAKKKRLKKTRIPIGVDQKRTKVEKMSIDSL